ncbi:hypothetical protein ACHQM5_018586 [Ranunculus cassubicifolius]
MAKFHHLNSSLFFIVLSIFFSHSTLISIQAKDLKFGTSLSPTKLGLRKEKLTHFQVYWQDVVTGPNPTSSLIIKSKTNTSSGFGNVVVFDDALTTGPELNSKLVGRAQGLLTATAQTEVGLLMTMNFVFLEGKYNGSTISIYGRNRVFSKVREMPIVGGSGLFRFARGYVEARTHKFNMKTGDATVQYTVYVLHY